MLHRGRSDLAGERRQRETARPDHLLASDDAKARALTVRIVTAYVVKHPTTPGDLLGLIRGVNEALADILLRTRQPEIRHRPTRADVLRSIQETHLVSFEDGKPYHMLKRHLSERGITPELYRAKWGLPDDYPMVAPFYARKRSTLAKRTLLGHYSRAEQAVRATTPRDPASDDTGSGMAGRESAHFPA